MMEEWHMNKRQYYRLKGYPSVYLYTEGVHVFRFCLDLYSLIEARALPDCHVLPDSHDLTLIHSLEPVSPLEAILLDLDENSNARILVQKRHNPKVKYFRNKHHGGIFATIDGKIYTYIPLLGIYLLSYPQEKDLVPISMMDVLALGAELYDN